MCVYLCASVGDWCTLWLSCYPFLVYTCIPTEFGSIQWKTTVLLLPWFLLYGSFNVVVMCLAVAKVVDSCLISVLAKSLVSSERTQITLLCLTVWHFLEPQTEDYTMLRSIICWPDDQVWVTYDWLVCCFFVTAPTFRGLWYCSDAVRVLDSYWEERKVRMQLCVCSKVYGYNSSQCNPVTLLQELTCHMGSHSVTCQLAEVTFLPLPQPKPVLDLVTRRDARLNWPTHLSMSCSLKDAAGVQMAIKRAYVMCICLFDVVVTLMFGW